MAMAATEEGPLDVREVGGSGIARKIFLVHHRGTSPKSAHHVGKAIG